MNRPRVTLKRLRELSRDYQRAGNRSGAGMMLESCRESVYVDAEHHWHDGIAAARRMARSQRVDVHVYRWCDQTQCWRFETTMDGTRERVGQTAWRDRTV